MSLSKVTTSVLILGILLFMTSGIVAAGDFRHLSFDSLSKFSCEGVDQKSIEKKKTCQVPEAVMAMNDVPVSIDGFMIPVEGTEDGQVTAFVLVRDQMSCCFGGSAKLNGWIYVTMAPGMITQYFDYEPIKVSGSFAVGFTNLKGQVLNLYRMEASAVGATNP